MYLFLAEGQLLLPFEFFLAEIANELLAFGKVEVFAACSCDGQHGLEAEHLLVLLLLVFAQVVKQKIGILVALKLQFEAKQPLHPLATIGLSKNVLVFIQLFDLAMDYLFVGVQLDLK